MYACSLTVFCDHILILRRNEEAGLPGKEYVVDMETVEELSTQFRDSQLLLWEIV
jgi:hypothetical protein